MAHDVDESEQLSGSGISFPGKRNSFALPFEEQIDVFYFILFNIPPALVLY